MERAFFLPPFSFSPSYTKWIFAMQIGGQGRASERASERGAGYTTTTSTARGLEGWGAGEALVKGGGRAPQNIARGCGGGRRRRRRRKSRVHAPLSLAPPFSPSLPLTVFPPPSPCTCFFALFPTWLAMEKGFAGSCPSSFPPIFYLFIDTFSIIKESHMWISRI